MVKQIVNPNVPTLSASGTTIGTALKVLRRGSNSRSRKQSRARLSPLVFDSHRCKALEADGLFAQRFVNDLTFAVLDSEQRLEGTLSLIQLLKLIEASLDGIELEHRHIEREEAVQRVKVQRRGSNPRGRERSRSHACLPPA